MACRTPSEAFRAYVEPLNEALQCVTREPLLLRGRERLVAGPPLTVAVREANPFPVRGASPLQMSVGQIVRVASGREERRGDAFVIVLAQYFYEIAMPDGREILSFHWTPEATGANVITFPHLHIGPALTSGQTVIRPGDVHKAHIPTGVVSLEAVIRLAIAEFGIRPLRPDWDGVLRQAGRMSA